MSNSKNNTRPTMKEHTGELSRISRKYWQTECYESITKKWIVLKDYVLEPIVIVDIEVSPGTSKAFYYCTFYCPWKQKKIKIMLSPETFYDMIERYEALVPK